MRSIRLTQPDVLLDRILREAVAAGASDVHLEPQASYLRVRFRIDGLLHEFYRQPLKQLDGLSVRTKVIGHMNVAESRRPQDGSCTMVIDHVPYDFRISILPPMYGENIVIRILSGQVSFIEKNDLGMLPVQQEAFRSALSRKAGMILTCGPTGSGKTSTLYAALKLLNREGVSIVSVEDPVEYRVAGVTQVQVNELAGLTFESGLRSIVRQDPDILMIGEIRDRETAEMAVHASLTGHLVLSTLHTNRASDAPLRLMDMGIPPYLLSASLSLVMAQRLAGKVCGRCGREDILNEETADALKLPGNFIGTKIRKGEGCKDCHEGLTGRTGVFELISIGREEREILRNQFSSDRFLKQMKKQGQPSMGEAALELMKAGVIPPSEASLILAGEE